MYYTGPTSVYPGFTPRLHSLLSLHTVLLPAKANINYSKGTRTKENMLFGIVIVTRHISRCLAVVIVMILFVEFSINANCKSFGPTSYMQLYILISLLILIGY